MARLQHQGRFTRQATPDGAVFTIHPAPPATGFLAAAWLLGALFGLPALAVAIDPGRHDLVSLLAALCGLAVVAVAALALRRARRGRAALPLRLDATGLTLPGGFLPWSELRGLRVAQPEAGRHAAAAPGLHALAARIAASQHAAEAMLLAETAGGTTLPLASGLGPAVAAALRDALLAERPALLTPMAGPVPGQPVPQPAAAGPVQ